MISNTNQHRLLQIILISGGLMILDQLVKYYALGLLTDAPNKTLEITRFFSLTLVYNYGVSFGMLSMPGTWMPYLLKALAIIISAVLVKLALSSACRKERTAYAAIIAGALGNTIDRVQYGAVVDFIYLHIGDLGWPAFNVADSCIFLGVSYLVWQTFFVRSSA